MPNLAVVTGGGTGIGRSCAVMLGARGLHVVIAGRTASTLEEARQAVIAAGGTAECVVADVGSASDVQRVVAAVGERPVQVLIHSAGSHISKTFTETTPDDYDEQVRVNLTGPFFLTQALVPRFTDGAGVVFVGSITAERARSLHTAYAMTKAGLLGLTKHLAAELAPTVRVNCVSPGGTATAMLQHYVEEAAKRQTEQEAKATRAADRSRILLRRVAQPDEVAVSIVHLALDATAVTGVDLAVDVGYKAS